MYQLVLIPAPARMAALWALQDPQDQVIASTDQGYCRRELADACLRLNRARRGEL